MLQNARRRYALQGFTVERRVKGWFYKSTYGDSDWKGPYSSIASATLMVARQLRKEVERRDKPFNLEP